MHKTPNPLSSRRSFLKNTGQVAAAGALAGLTVPRVHAAEDNTLRIALIGCGGRGTGAAANALAVDRGPTKLVAVADVFDNRLQGSLNSLGKMFADRVDVPEDRRFVGFDGYRNAIDCLEPGDIVILATPPAFRWVHFAYAVEKGMHVFMEKPVTVDGPTSRRMLETAQQSVDKNLKVGVGLMSRHSRPMQELHERIQEGRIGQIVSMRGYRMGPPIASAFSNKWPGTGSELLWQIQRFHSFLWASGGCFSDFYIHLIDHCCWMKDAWPIKAQGIGGRHYRLDAVDQNFDSYAVEYVFEDGARLTMDGRCMNGADRFYSSYAHGTKGSAILSKHGDCGGPSSIHCSQTPDPAKRIWQSEVARDLRNPYQNEWNALVDAIRCDRPFNEAKRGIEASMVCSLGRKAAHTAKEVTFEEMLHSEEEFAPGVDKFTMDSPPPLPSDEEGRYPIPRPGIITDREY